MVELKTAQTPEDQTLPLRNEMLSKIPDHVSVPRYERGRLTPGIVHVGLGNFHRAHQAWYLHRLMQEGHAYDWAVIGAGIRPNDEVMRSKLMAQDCLTTLIELEPTGSSAEVIGPMIDFLPVESFNAPLIRMMADPAIRIVSLTVTEGGYFMDRATGGFDERHPEIVHDAKNPTSPTTLFGGIVEALRRRRASGAGPFTLLSCDNLLRNGDQLRQTVVSLASLSNEKLADWINGECSFPNSMVDCIVPTTGPRELALVEEFGIADAAPVTHENFRQWVIEDEFCAGRPYWEGAGATFSNAVHDYETLKVHVLNVGHQVLANAGEILSVPTIPDCMAHPGISALFRKVQAEEIIPYVNGVPEYSPKAYLDLIERRFSNPAIPDTTRRVAFDGSSRHPGFVLPILRDAMAKGGSIDGLALVEALWARMCEGTREDGSRIEPNDPNWSTLQVAAKGARSEPRIWLAQEYYGDLQEDQAFTTTFCRWLTKIWSDGCQPVLERYSARSH